MTLNLRKIELNNTFKNICEILDVRKMFGATEWYPDELKTKGTKQKYVQ